MPKPIKVEVGQPFGGKGGGVSKSAEEYMNTYGFKALTDVKTLKMLADLPIYDTKEKLHDVISFDKSDWEVIGYKGETVGGAQYMFNRILDTMEIPYVAKTGISKEARKAGKTTRVLKQGKNAGDERSEIVADILKIIRYGEEFDETQYATTRAGKVSKKSGKVISHEDSPAGLVEAVESWLTSDAVDIDYDVLEKVGLVKRMAELGVEFEE
jgi:hypothetical protein